MSIRKDKIDFFEQTVADFFHKAGREYLPWRKKGITAYEVWVSEIMLQQTQFSRVIVEKYQGIFPQDRKTLENIPGIGPYTAAAILSFAYG